MVKLNEDCGGATYAKYTANRVINASSSSCFATLWTTSTRIMEHCSTRNCDLVNYNFYTKGR